MYYGNSVLDNHIGEQWKFVIMKGIVVEKMVILGKANKCILADSKWLKRSKELEITLVVTEDSVEEIAESGVCRFYVSMQRFLNNIEEYYQKNEIFFVADDCNVIHERLIERGISKDRIYVHANIYGFLCPELKMRFLEEAIYMRDHKKYVNRFVSVGRFTYGVPKIRFCSDEKEAIKIGSFCSIAGGVTIFGGGEHRTDWMSTYPFNVFLKEDFKDINGHPATKGQVTIGNDVWIGSGATILSGVTIGDGAVIGTNAVVAKNVPPYAICAGNPAKLIRNRFSDEVIAKFSEMKWWDWDYEEIYEAVPLLQNEEIDKLWEFYVSKCKAI